MDPDDDSLLANSKYLTRQEVLKRRVHRLRQLARCYRDHYWSLTEELRRKHREYYWMYGKGPCKDEEDEDEAEERDNGVGTSSAMGNGVNGNMNGENVGSGDKLGVEYGKTFSWCSYKGCEGKAMALTRYCILHIMSDSKQVLYRKCTYPQLRDGGRIGSLLCNKAILKATTPPLCQRHAQDAKKHISQALKKGGVPATLSNKVATKFHLVINEYVQLIQSNRRAIARKNKGKIALENGDN